VNFSRAMRFGEVWLNNADGRGGGASNFRSSEIVSDATVMVDLGAEKVIATVLASYSERFTQCPKK